MNTDLFWRDLINVAEPMLIPPVIIPTIHCTVDQLPVDSYIGAAASSSEMLIIGPSSYTCQRTTDGINFSSTTMPTHSTSGITRYYKCIANSGSTFCVVAYNGNKSSVSVNGGLTWTLSSTTLPGARPWIGVAFGNGVFCTIAYYTSIAATSPDGLTWTERALPSSRDWRFLVFLNSKFYTLCSTHIASSSNGIDWVEHELSFTPRFEAHSLAWNGSVFVLSLAVPSHDMTDQVATSTNGIDWSVGTLSSASYWSAVLFDGTYFVAFGSDSNWDNPKKVAYSTDGLVWEELEAVGAGDYFWTIALFKGKTRAITGYGTQLSVGIY